MGICRRFSPACSFPPGVPTAAHSLLSLRLSGSRRALGASLTFPRKLLPASPSFLLVLVLQRGLVEGVEVALAEAGQLLIIFHSRLTCGSHTETTVRGLRHDGLSQSGAEGSSPDPQALLRPGSPPGLLPPEGPSWLLEVLSKGYL